MAQKSLLSLFVIGGNAILVYIIYNRILHPVGFPGKDQATVIFHHLVGSCPEETGVGSALFACHRILGLVTVAVAGGCRQNGHRLQRLAADAVQGLANPLRFQAGLFFIIHMPEVTTTAELGHGALPVHPMGRFFQHLHDLTGCPGLLSFLDADFIALPANRIGQKHGTAFHMGNTLAFGRVVGDHRFVNFVLLQH